jgi:hypothetical protein
MAGMFFTAFLHLQFLIGLVMYFLSPRFQMISQMGGDVMKDSTMRFYIVEHPVMMLIAVVLATVGRAKSKRLVEDSRKHRTTLVFFLIALIIVFLGIPWPFRFEGATLY